MKCVLVRDETACFNLALAHTPSWSVTPVAGLFHSALSCSCAGRHLPVPHSRPSCQKTQRPTTRADAAWHWGLPQPHHSAVSCLAMDAGRHPLKAALMTTRATPARAWSHPLLRAQAGGQRSDAQWPSGSTTLAPGSCLKALGRTRLFLSSTKRAWTTSREWG